MEKESTINMPIRREDAVGIHIDTPEEVNVLPLIKGAAAILREDERPNLSPTKPNTVYTISRRPMKRI